jgi:hypothetical protein
MEEPDPTGSPPGPDLAKGRRGDQRVPGRRHRRRLVLTPRAELLYRWRGVGEMLASWAPRRLLALRPPTVTALASPAGLPGVTNG